MLFDVNLEKVESAKRFVQAMSKFSGDVIARSGQSVVDGKSIMGVLSLNLSENVHVEMKGDDKGAMDAVVSEIRDLVM